MSESNKFKQQFLCYRYTCHISGGHYDENLVRLLAGGPKVVPICCSSPTKAQMNMFHPCTNIFLTEGVAAIRGLDP